jgi:hypothetical protein
MSITINITDEQAAIIRRWLDAHDSLSRSHFCDYALGCCYIDERVRSDRRMTDRRRYVRLDHETVEMVPALAGRTAADIRRLLDRREVHRTTNHFSSCEQPGPVTDSPFPVGKESMGN